MLDPDTPNPPQLEVQIHDLTRFPNLLPGEAPAQEVVPDSSCVGLENFGTEIKRFNIKDA